MAARGRHRGALPSLHSAKRPSLTEPVPDGGSTDARGLPPSAAPSAPHLLGHKSAQLHAALLVPARHQLQRLGQAEPQLGRHPAAGSPAPGGARHCAGWDARRAARAARGGRGNTDFRSAAVTGSAAAAPPLALPDYSSRRAPRRPASPAAGAVRERSEALPLAQSAGTPRVGAALAVPSASPALCSPESPLPLLPQDSPGREPFKPESGRRPGRARQRVAPARAAGALRPRRQPLAEAERGCRAVTMSLQGFGSGIADSTSRRD